MSVLVIVTEKNYEYSDSYGGIFFFQRGSAFVPVWYMGALISGNCLKYNSHPEGPPLHPDGSVQIVVVHKDPSIKNNF